MNILIIGGTRNIGVQLVHELLAQHHRVTILNRGKTKDDLPDHIERLRADRTDPEQLRRALSGRAFDVVVDNALYKGAEVPPIVELFSGNIGRYIFISSGQVYLVREGAPRPSRESDYDGLLMPAPKPNTFGYEEWMYGMDKRRAEDALQDAWQTQQFPYTSLRLPMVNSERDHFFRLYNYILRLKDGFPILAPSTPNYNLRHVYVGDVVRAIGALIDQPGVGLGRAYNISQEETLSLEEFLDILGAVMGVGVEIVRVKRDVLEANGFLPDCSPFSERWMSELDNTRSKVELGITYTPVRDYLARIVRYYEQNQTPKPSGYRRRRAEHLLLEHAETIQP